MRTAARAPVAAFLIALSFAASALASTPSEVTSIADATIKLCQDTARAVRNHRPTLMGCADRVVEGEGSHAKSYLLDFATSLSTGERAALKSQLKALRSDAKVVEIEASVTGIKSKEDGHFPNPMATFDVFRLVSFSPQ